MTKDADYVSLRNFFVRKISKKAVRLRPSGLARADELDGWVPFSLFEEQSLIRAVKAVANMGQVTELRIQRWKAEQLGWVKPSARDQETRLVE